MVARRDHDRASAETLGPLQHLIRLMISILSQMYEHIEDTECLFDMKICLEYTPMLPHNVIYFICH